MKNNFLGENGINPKTIRNIIQFYDFSLKSPLKVSTVKSFLGITNEILW